MNCPLRRRKVPVSRQGESKGVAIHLLIDLAGVVENGTRYSQSSTSWMLPSASASDGGNHVETSVPINSTAKLNMSSKHRCSLILQRYKGVTFTDVTLLLRYQVVISCTSTTVIPGVCKVDVNLHLDFK